jgi:thioredoxin:protein disulfide reductase
VAGADAVSIEAYLSHSSVPPGGRFWIGFRLKVADGYHVNSHQPGQDYLIPTTIVLEENAAFRPVRVSYPEPHEYEAPFQQERLSVFTGDLLLGIELEAAAGLQPGTHPLALALRTQPCDDQQCYPPLEARVRLAIPLTAEAGREQYPEVFEPLRRQAG